MARYGDLDALEKKLFPIGMVDDGRYALPAKAVKVAIDRLPTADVVPRAEVERMLKEAQDNYEEWSGLKQAKIDVAREIFAEINAIKKEYASGDIDGNELYVRLYMLEKKYTEGKT